MYTIKSYLIHDIDDGCILQNGISTVIIKNDKLKRFLENVEQKGVQKISVDFIKQEFQEQYDDVTKFLLENQIIFEYHEPDLNWNKIWVISNDHTFSNYFKYSIEGSGEDIINLTITDNELDLDNLKENDLCIVFLNPFDINKYIEICDLIKEKNAIIKTVFFYNHSIYISNFHKKDWFNPCPKCFFYSLETQLRGGLTPNGSFNFQTLIDLLYSNEVKFNIETKLNPVDLITTMNVLSRDLRHTGNVNNIINNVYEIGLNLNELNEDIAYHWEMCDCYE